MNKPRIEIIELNVSCKKNRKLFIDLTYNLASRYLNWRPGLRLYYDQLINPKKNPFWDRAEAMFYLVKKENVIVAHGGVLPPGYLKELPHAAILIFPDFTDDIEVVQAFLQKAEMHAKSRDATQIVGPFNPNIHYDVGIQYVGFERANSVFMGYQPPYYSGFLEQCGYQKLHDFSAWELYKETFVRDGILSDMSTRVLRNQDIILRQLNLSRFNEELSLFYRLYCASFSDHWGFSCPGWNEFKFIAGDLRYLLKSKMALVAEYKKQPVGFVLGIPDFYSVINRKFNGKLTLASITSLFLKFKKIKTVRVMIAGILPEYRFLGIHIPLFYQVALNIFDLGYEGGEIAWVMDDNSKMNRILPLLGAQRTKGYRLYMKQLV